MAEVTALPQPGDTFAGKYLLERVIGSGRASLVFSARHLSSGKRVAIDWSLPGTDYVWHGALLDVADDRESLEADEQDDSEEARDAAELVSDAGGFGDDELPAIGQFRHPNVFDVYDFGEAFGSRYCVLEWADGESLEARIQRAGRMTVSEATRLLVPCLRAMHEAHTVGIVHHDLKPSNIFICQATESMSEVVKVLDFDLTAAGAGDEDIGSLVLRRATTSTKPYYRAPEQFGDVEIDHRADVYAFGAILYELLTGWPPFAPIRHVNREDLTPTRQAVLQARSDRLPAGADALVGRAMARDVTQRFQTLHELADALQAFSRRDAASRGMIVHRMQEDAAARVADPSLQAQADSESASSRSTPAGEGTGLRRRPWPRPPAVPEDPVIAIESDDEPSAELAMVKPVWNEPPARELHEWSDPPPPRALRGAIQPNALDALIDTDQLPRIELKYVERLPLPRGKNAYIAAAFGVSVAILIASRYWWGEPDTEVVASFAAATNSDEPAATPSEPGVAPISPPPSASGTGYPAPVRAATGDLGRAPANGPLYRLPLRAAGTAPAPRAPPSIASPAAPWTPGRDGKSASESRGAQARPKAASALAPASKGSGPKRPRIAPSSPAPAASGDQLPMKLM